MYIYPIGFIVYISSFLLRSKERLGTVLPAILRKTVGSLSQLLRLVLSVYLPVGFDTQSYSTDTVSTVLNHCTPSDEVHHQSPISFRVIWTFCRNKSPMRHFNTLF